MGLYLAQGRVGNGPSCFETSSRRGGTLADWAFGASSEAVPWLGGAGGGGTPPPSHPILAPMAEILVEPWLPPPQPDLARLAMEAADAAGLVELRDWPEFIRGGVGFRGLPIFLPWYGRDGGGHILVLVQPREVGAIVPGARPQPMPEGWLEDLDLEALALPLARHPAFGGQAHVQVVQVLAAGQAKVRALGPPAPAVVAAVLARLTGLEPWTCQFLPW